MPVETARAKINLNLHVGRLVDDPAHKYFGYHPLSSLVVFADFGDELSCHDASETSLEISGPFSQDLDKGASNLVLRAYSAVSEITALPNLNFKLEKNLPIASGIGGGSADAAAALRLLKNYADLPEITWLEIALSLGADVPVCYHSQTSVMTGIGEDIVFAPDLGQAYALLVNSGTAVSTAEVFKLFDQQDLTEDFTQSSAPSLLERALAGRNDLGAPACGVAPEINNVLDSIRHLQGCQIARLSGSGGTCFGIFENRASSNEAAKIISRNFPDWWVQPVMLGDQV